MAINNFGKNNLDDLYFDEYLMCSNPIKNMMEGKSLVKNSLGKVFAAASAPQELRMGSVSEKSELIDNVLLSAQNRDNCVFYVLALNVENKNDWCSEILTEMDTVMVSTTFEQSKTDLNEYMIDSAFVIDEICRMFISGKHTLLVLQSFTNKQLYHAEPEEFCHLVREHNDYSVIQAWNCVGNGSNFESVSEDDIEHMFRESFLKQDQDFEGLYFSDSSSFEIL